MTCRTLVQLPPHWCQECPVSFSVQFHIKNPQSAQSGHWQALHTSSCSIAPLGALSVRARRPGNCQLCFSPHTPHRFTLYFTPAFLHCAACCSVLGSTDIKDAGHPLRICRVPLCPRTTPCLAGTSGHTIFRQHACCPGQWAGTSTNDCTHPK
jgi:hypothetical protein